MNLTVAPSAIYSYTPEQVINFKNNIASCGHQVNKIAQENIKKFLNEKKCMCKDYILYNSSINLSNKKIIKDNYFKKISHQDCYTNLVEWAYSFPVTYMSINNNNCINQNKLQQYNSAAEFIHDEIDTCIEKSCSNGIDKNPKSMISDFKFMQSTALELRISIENMQDQIENLNDEFEMLEYDINQYEKQEPDKKLKEFHQLYQRLQQKENKNQYEIDTLAEMSQDINRYEEAAIIYKNKHEKNKNKIDLLNNKLVSLKNKKQNIETSKTNLEKIISNHK